MLFSHIKRRLFSVHFLMLLGLLLFTCIPLTWPVNLPFQFWIKQGVNFFIWTGLFYLNFYLLVPRFLDQGKGLLFAILVLSAIIIIVAFDHQLENLLNLPEIMEKIFLKQNPGVRLKDPPLADLSVLIFTLIDLGISTIAGITKKHQDDRLKAQNIEKEQIRSELSFLKSQINPHFFFNILHTIYALTETNTDAARDSIYTLSHMMRYVLYDTKNDVTSLAKEVAFVEDYIKLMKLRLTDSVQVIFDKPANLKNVEVAPMLFLPFTENAFKHGISNIYPSYIYIGIRQIGKTLIIEVRNSIFQEKAENMEESNGIGLVNTRRRLDLIYPGKYSLKVDRNDAANEFIVELKLNLP